MKTSCVAFACGMILSITAICATEAPPKPQVYEVKQVFGPLDFDGTIHRHESGENYRFEIATLKVTFRPERKPNTLDRIDLKQIRITASKRPIYIGDRTDVIFRDTKPFIGSLTVQAPRLTISGVEFVIPKAMIAAADSVGFSITDGRMLWIFGGGLIIPRPKSVKALLPKPPTANTPLNTQPVRPPTPGIRNMKTPTTNEAETLEMGVTEAQLEEQAQKRKVWEAGLANPHGPIVAPAEKK